MASKTVYNDHKRAVFDALSGCVICDGPKSIFKHLGLWECNWKNCAGTQNRPEDAYCREKGCGGLPPSKHREGQAAAQQKHQKKHSLKVGAAPYVPPAKRGGKTETATQRELREAKAETRRVQGELKKLQADKDQGGKDGQGGQQGATTGGVGTTATAAEVKEIEGRLRTAKGWAAKNPGKASYSAIVDEIQAELDAAKPPPKSVPTGELQAELEKPQGSNDWAKQQVA